MYRFLVVPYKRGEVTLYSYKQIKGYASEFPILINKLNAFLQDGEISRSEFWQLEKEYNKLKLERIKEEIRWALSNSIHYIPIYLAVFFKKWLAKTH